MQGWVTERISGVDVNQIHFDMQVTTGMLKVMRQEQEMFTYSVEMYVDDEHTR